MNHLKVLIIGLALAVIAGTYSLVSWQKRVEKSSEHRAVKETWDVIQANLIALDPAKALDLSNRLSEDKKLILMFGIAYSDEINATQFRLRSTHIAYLFDSGQVVPAMRLCRRFGIPPSVAFRFCQQMTATAAVDTLDNLIQEMAATRARFPHLGDLFGRDIDLLKYMRQALTGGYPHFFEDESAWPPMEEVI